MSDDTPKRPPRFYGSDAENIKGVDNLTEAGLVIRPDEFEFKVSYADGAKGFSIARKRSFNSGSGGEL